MKLGIARCSAANEPGAFVKVPCCYRPIRVRCGGELTRARKGVGMIRPGPSAGSGRTRSHASTACGFNDGCRARYAFALRGWARSDERRNALLGKMYVESAFSMPDCLHHEPFSGWDAKTIHEVGTSIRHNAKSVKRPLWRSWGRSTPPHGHELKSGTM